MDRSCCFGGFLTAVLVYGLAFPGTASAQDIVARDYYLAGSDPAAARTLRNVERYHYEPALKYLRSRNYRYAQNDLEFILKYFPNHPQALAKISEIGLAVKRPDLAEEHFRNAIERYPQRDETHVIYGTFLHKLGHIDAAIAEYRKALEINASSVYAHYNLGLAYVDRKDYSEANVHAQKAYQLGAGFPALRRKLQAAGAWRPLETTSSSPVSPSSSAQQERKAD